MSVPIERMSQLSLESMSASTNFQSQGRVEDSGESSYESDGDAGFEYDERSNIAVFPSGIRYSLLELDIGTRESVVKAINASSKFASRFTLRRYQDRNDHYVFLLSESTEHHVRLGKTNGRYVFPSCSCQQDGTGGYLEQHPCRHTLWFCDQIAKQILPYQHQPYSLGMAGWTTKEGNLCDDVELYGLDMLATGLNCVSFENRVRTAREILATIGGTSVQELRGDLQDSNQVIKQGDLEQTVFRMLLHNDALYSYFLSSLRHFERLNPRFRPFRDQVDAALTALDELPRNSLAQDFHKEFDRCFTRFKHVEQQIMSLRLHSEPDRELDEFDQRAAVYTLIVVLCRALEYYQNREWRNEHGEIVPFNLCQKLIDESSPHFILDLLGEFDSEILRYFSHDLAKLAAKLVEKRMPQSYIDKLNSIISIVNADTSTSESEAAESSRGNRSSNQKRSSQELEHSAKRVK
ncbi:hypothetical protein F5Y16DRAFT_397277 [Xylariaceae sp. FL0255]|nr:hypothetical protein F5Y16DRAFT_397277 [Xylariaceae sp. FL0255]